MGELQLSVESAGRGSAHHAALQAAAAFRGVAMGYNHEVAYGGRIFHVQTEDSGASKRHVSTHVFHSGVIIASDRVGYGESSDDVIELLRSTHKAMLRRLIRGALDEAIMRNLDGVKASEPEVAVEEPRLEVVCSSETTADESASSERQESESLVQARLEELRHNVSGALGVALLDDERGECRRSAVEGLDIEAGATGLLTMARASLAALQAAGVESPLEDLVVNSDTQCHVLRPLGSDRFVYLVLDRARGNAALAKYFLDVSTEGLQSALESERQPSLRVV